MHERYSTQSEGVALGSSNQERVDQHAQRVIQPKTAKQNVFHCALILLHDHQSQGKIENGH